MTESMNTYILEAIRRNKDNPELSGKELCVRQIVKDHKIDLLILKNKASLLGDGVWRIYRTVNLRDVKKAHTDLVHFLIDNPEKTHIDSIWKSIL